MRNLRLEQEIMKDWKGDVSSPLVSISCLAYNHEKFIEDALEGFLTQKTDFPFEILIHDDASTDRTADIIREYESLYPNLIKPIYQTENQFSKRDGKAGQVQRGRAKGKYCALCEGDDYWTDQDKLQKQVDIMEDNPEFSGCFHETQQIFEDGRPGKIYGRDAHEILTTEDTIATLSPFHTSSFVYRNIKIIFPEWFSKVVSKDMALFSIISSFGPLKKISQVMSVYRKHDEGLANTNNAINNFHRHRIELMNYINKFHDFKYDNKVNQVIAIHKKRLEERNQSSTKHQDNMQISKPNQNKIVIIQGGFPSISATFILDQMTGLIDRGFEIENWATYNTGTTILHSEIEKFNLLNKTKFLAEPPIHLTNDPGEWLKTFMADNNIESLDDISAFHVHYGASFNKFEPLFRLNNKFVLVSFHGYDASKYFLQMGDNCYDYLFERANLITTPSHFMKNELVKRGCNPDKIVIHRYGIDLMSFASKNRVFMKDKITFLTVGRFVEKKGIEFSLKAFAKIHKKIKSEYRIIGEGSLYEKYLEFVEKEGIGEHVKFLGPKTKTEVIQEMQNADVFVLTSVVAKNGDSEGVPVALTEAHAMGLPVVSTYHSGIPELVIHKKTGLLSPEKDIDSIAENMLKIASDKDLRMDLSKNAEARVKDEFDIIKLNDRLYSLLISGINQYNFIDKNNKCGIILQNEKVRSDNLQKGPCVLYSKPLNSTDTLSINWVLTRKCNYTCTYCTVKDNKTGFFHDIKPLKSVIDKISFIKKKRIRFTITGGEPTICPNYIELLEYIFHKLGDRARVSTITNLSMPLSFFENVRTSLHEYLDKISFIASYHFEHADREQFVEKVNFLSQNGIYVKTQILAHPEYMNVTRRLFDGLDQTSNNKLKIDVKIVRENFGSKPDKRYTSLDLEWLQKFYDESINKDVEVVFLNGNHGIDNLKFSANELIANNLNNYKGYECHAGLESISINANGDIDPAVCFRSKKEGKPNVFTSQNPFAHFNKPVICPFDKCGCLSDLRLTKKHIDYEQIISSSVLEGKTSFENNLNQKAWQNKKALYSYYFESVNFQKHVDNPSVSIIVISWRLHPDNLENFKILEKQRNQNFELIFVDNGGKEGEFEPLKPYIDTYVRLNSNTGAYLARNIGSVFANAPILIFLEDDGIPEHDFIKTHIKTHEKYDVISMRGVYKTKTENTLNKLAIHYYLGDLPFPHPCNLEGNCSYRADIFFAAGGWDDDIVFGYGGRELSIRLLNIEPDPRKQIYTPDPVIYHDFAADETHLSEKIKKQEFSLKRLREKYSDWDAVTESWSKYNGRHDLLILRESSYKEKILPQQAVFGRFLRQKGWGYKESTYAECFESVTFMRKVNSPAVSIVVISWRLHHDNLKSFQILEKQRDKIFELIFVDNGGKEGEFDPLKPYIDTYVRLNKNKGAYLPRNIGAVFANAPILLFLEDDGIPESNLIKAHLDLFDEYEIIACRGVYTPKTDNPMNKHQGHYYISEKEYPTFAHVEGNTSYLAETFFKAGGWDDEIEFGGGGLELYFRLLKIDPDKRKQIYSPKPVIYHDYVKDETHLKNKLEKQKKSFERLRIKYPEWDEVHNNYRLNCDRDDLLIKKDDNYKKKFEQPAIIKQNKIKKVLFVNHSLFPFETSGTPLSTLNHALGMTRLGLEVAVLIPGAKMKKGWKKEPVNGITLYRVLMIEKFAAYFAAPGQDDLSEYRRSIEQIIDDFCPQIVQINDYVYMPAEIIELFSNKGCIVVRNVCNCEELCHQNYPVLSSGLDGRLCSGPESTDKCADCFKSLPSAVADRTVSLDLLRSVDKKIEIRFEYVKRIYLDSVDKVIFTSEPFKKYYTQFIPIPEDKIKIIPRGFKFDFAREVNKRKKRDEVVHFAFVGNIMFSKGIDVVLNAFEKICKDNNFMLHVYGQIASPEFPARLKSLESGHPDRFIYHGQFEEKDLPKIAASIDVCIIPSYFDTYNRVLREFLYLGVPVIVTDFFGSYIVNDGTNGYKIPIGDTDALAGKMTDIIRRPDIIEDLAHGAANTRIPSLEEEINMLIETYNDLYDQASEPKKAILDRMAKPDKRQKSSPEKSVRMVAFYLPQYHPIPENDKWWGKGFTEWTNVAKARPLFPGHYQPHLPADLGFYDLRLAETRKAQAELARESGIEGFCYWHYWFSGKRLLDQPFQSVLQSGEPDFPFCLAWANETWSRRWLGEEKDILMKQEYSEEDDYKHALWLITAFRDKRHIKINNRPLFLIYRPKDLPNPNKTVEILRQTCLKNGIENPYLIGIDAHCMNFDCRIFGFDETLSFMPQLSYLPEFMNDDASDLKRQRNRNFGVDSAKLKIYDYEETMDVMLKGLNRSRHPVIPSLFVGWDNTPRRGENGIIITNTSPQKFGRALRMLVDSVQDKPPQNRFVFLNAWNEWAEGNHLEPDMQNGHKFLEEIRKVKSESKFKISHPSEPSLGVTITGHDASIIRAIAFYLPQYHPIPENDRWWGKGFTEWSNVSKALPVFPGHYQPHVPAELGYYDLRIPEIRKAQADMAREHGIYGFCYYHYWFNGKILLDYPLQQVLKSGQPDFPFCLCWANENWSRAWDGQDSDILIKQDYSPEDDLEHIRHLVRIFNDRRYIKIDGKPLFIVYRASNMPDPMKTTSLWREEARRMGMGELFLCRVERFIDDMKDPRPLGFDAAIEFQPDGIHLGKPIDNPEYKDNFVYEYDAMVRAALSKKDPAYLRFPCVCPSWDNSPRRQKNAVIFNHSTPQLYESWLKEVLSRTAGRRPEERIVFINAFNEWGEGCHLEPDQMNGRAYLEATRRAVLACKRDDKVKAESPHKAGRSDTVNISSGASPRVSIIIPLFNKLEYTRQCLDALIENTPDELYEVIIVDNASTDGTKGFLSTLEGDVTTIRNETNMGFAHACNQGADAARGDYLMFLNNDTEPRKGWLEPLIQILDDDSAVAAAGSKLLFPDGTVQHAGVAVIEDRKLPDPLVARHIFYQQSADRPETNQLRTYQALTAACILIRKDYFKKAGGFDEEYWNGYEDVDLCFKLQEHGWRLVYQPESVVIHHESKSGPERFNKVDHNIRRLHERWIGKIKPDVIINEDGSITNTDARKIRQYIAHAGIKPGNASVEPVTATRMVSIIILTFNQLKYTIKCIESIGKFTPEPHELILVDNGSTDGTKDFLNEYARNNDHITLILNEENRGFAGGNNQGMARAKGDYIALLNNDVVVTEHWLERMISHLERHPDIGMVGPMSNAVSGPQLVENIPYGKDMKAMHRFARDFTAGNMVKTSEIMRLVGFCLLIKRDVIDIIGGLDEKYISGNFEDDDLCLRSAIAGYKNIIARDVFVHHYGSMTFKGNSIDYNSTMEGNRRHFIEKWKDIVEFNGDRYNFHVTKEQRLKKLLEWGEERFSRGDAGNAEKIFKRMLKLDPADSQALNNLGVMQWQLGDIDSAMKTFQTALGFNPKDPDALGNLVQAAAETGRFDLIDPGLLGRLKQAQAGNPDLETLIKAQQNSVMAI